MAGSRRESRLSLLLALTALHSSQGSAIPNPPPNAAAISAPAPHNLANSPSHHVRATPPRIGKGRKGGKTGSDGEDDGNGPPPEEKDENGRPHHIGAPDLPQAPGGGDEGDAQGEINKSPDEHNDDGGRPARIGRPVSNNNQTSHGDGRGAGNGDGKPVHIGAGEKYNNKDVDVPILLLTLILDAWKKGHKSQS
ncbi:uncharacterized protein EI97DRAFT_504921 [Westerdykella ornata]|uniref:Uncharacterized protein n=1 Tax=Westerdykella ornata TaxID=318751 RepID=A0A6A6J797_WESOR|nr:uncharacterized protein EI97DRAFT_504921 [Westerdykella ornata]KAF2271516.1 hypothetical protein EI97DRAFT_504921 [Westerdykella ornata]